MPKVKIPRKSTLVDMTAMCDVAFLLLTFFILTTKMRTDDAVIVDYPASISDIKIPESDIMTISIDKTGAVYFGVDGKFNRERLLRSISERYKIQFTPEEEHQFSLVSSFGVPIKDLKEFLNMPASERTSFKQTGIPCDSTKNELADWVILGRIANPKYRIAINADKAVKFPVVKNVMNTLQDKKVNRFNLITSLRAKPELN
jgi:biopolymer transport protein ExbD